MSESKPQSMFDESYHDKLEEFKKRKNTRLEQLHEELDGTHTPLLNSKTYWLASKNPDASLPAHERLLEAQKKQAQRLEDMKARQNEEMMQHYSFRPEITEAGKAFTRDKPLLESLHAEQELAVENIKAKQNQKLLREQEELQKPVDRIAKKQSDKIAMKSKYAGMKPEDRLLAREAEALEKYANSENKQPDAEEMALKESTFSPKINAHSMKLASSKERDGDVFQSLFNSGMQTELKKKEMNRQKFNKSKVQQEDIDTSKFRENDILRRYEEQLDRRAIEMALAEEEDRERRRFRMTESSRHYLEEREEELEKYNEKITYRKPYEPEEESSPEVCEKSQRIVGNRPDITTRLYNMAQVIRQRQESLEEEGKKIDMQQCTFEPEVETNYEITSTFEERTRRVMQRREKMLAELQDNDNKKNGNQCTFRPTINDDRTLDKFRKSAMYGTVYSEAAKSSELEVRAINSHIEREMKSRVQETPKKSEWTIEPTVEQPFRASYISENASALRTDLNEEGARFLDEFDISMAAGFTGELVQSPLVYPEKETVVCSVDKNLTNFHKIVASVKYQMTDNQVYQEEREERRFLEAASML